MLKRHLLYVFLIGSFLPSVSFSQEKKDTDGGKDYLLIPKIARPIDSLNSKKACSGDDVEIHYCLEGRTLYKPKISLSLQQHRLKWNLREDKFVYTYNERYIIELDDKNDIIYYKYKILFEI